MKAAILGYGVSGKSSENLLKHLLNINDILIYDDKDSDCLPIKEFNDEFFDLVVISPGINLSNLAIKDKRKIVSEYELSFNLAKNKTFIGITGTNGKSTTTFLTSQLFEKVGLKSVACGNIGYPLGEAILEDYDYFIVEFSSFQIDLLKEGKYLDAAAIINLTPDHLDRYGSFEKYVNSKLRISKMLKECGYLVVGKDITAYFDDYDTVIDSQFKEYPKLDDDCLIFGEFYINIRKFPLIGNHNLVNLSFALEILSQFYDLKGDVTDLITDLKGLAHRCEIVDTINGITFVNDSKGTNVDSTLTALNGFEGNVILLLGGLDKEGDFSKLNDVVNEKCKYVICFGKDGEKIYQQINFSKKFLVSNLKEAFDMGVSVAKKGDTILLSPACASFDEFKNFEERGEYFKKMVKEYGSK